VKQGHGIVIHPLDGSGKYISITRAEGYVYVAATEATDSGDGRVLCVTLDFEQALELAAAIRKAAKP
jgi:hypothetical protein